MRLSFGTKLSYGIGGLADNTMYTLTGTYLLFFLTTVVGLEPAIAGTITALGSVWEAICGPIVGYSSDRIETRFGKRKPFLLFAAFPVAIVSTLLFTSIDAGYGFKVVYYAVMILLFWTSFASFFVPYMTWGSDLTDDYDERTVLRSYAYVFNQLGMAVGMVLPTMIVDLLVSMGKTVETGWMTVGLFSGVCAGGALLICALTNKHSDIKDFKKPETKEKILSAKAIKGMFKEYLSILKVRPIRFVIAASVCYLIANTIFSSDRVYYLSYNLGFSSNTISLTMLVITVAGIAFVPVVALLANKWDKKYVFCYGIGISGVIMMGLRFVNIDSLPMVILVCLVYSVANTCYWQLMPSIIYDVCEVEELCSGEKHSGAVISLQALSESVSMAVGFQLLGINLSLAGFDAELAVQTDSALNWVSNNFTFIPGLFMVILVFAILKYPIDKKVFTRVLDELKLNREGKEKDREELLKILGVKK
ncbi:MAG: MFS transporter [Clostridia bacterium]|nr:MFS transporter [Clostridia bacterium]